MAEYYLSNQFELERTTFQRRVIVVPIHDMRFNIMLSPVGLFFLLLSLNVSVIQELIVLDPKSMAKYVKQKSDGYSQNNDRLLTLPHVYRIQPDYHHIYWKYSANATMNERFVVKSNQSQLFHQLGLPNPMIICHNSSDMSLNSDKQVQNSPLYDTSSAVVRFGSDPIPSSLWFPSYAQSSQFRQKLNIVCPSTSKNIFVVSNGKQHTNARIINDAVYTSSGSRSPEQLFNGDTTRFKLVIYMRDFNRKIFSFDELYRRLLMYVIAGGGIKGYERRQKLSAASNFQYSDYFTPVSNATSGDIHIFYGEIWSLWVVHHDEERDPCVLTEVFRDADMFLTVHGFQCMGKNCFYRFSLHYSLIFIFCL